jgi:hypothetical protein
MKCVNVIARRLAIGVLVTVISLGSNISTTQATPLAQQDLATITSPTDGQTLNGVVNVTGSADHPDFNRYELAYGPDPNPNDAWQVFATGTQRVSSGTLGAWNTGIIADGTYMLRLRVVRQDSNYSEAVVRGLQVSNSQPAGTPTSIPPAPTFPAEEPTFAAEQGAAPVPTIVIEQPPTSEPITATASSSAANINQPRRTSGPSTSSSLNAGNVASNCLGGAVLAAGVFAVIGAMQFGRYSYKQFLRFRRRRASH